MECYIISFDFFIIPLLAALWFMLPAYVPNPVAALLGGGTPVDLGRNFYDGRRVFGDGKTYRGLLLGTLSGVGVGLLLIWLQNVFRLETLPHHTPVSITLLALGALLGDMGKSFFKRRLGKERGEKWPGADQYDLVAGSFLLMLVVDPLWVIDNVTLPVMVIILVITPLLHRVMNIIGYFFRIKEVPW